MKITGIIVGLNEGELLENCISKLFWCSEVLYFDLGSKDCSKEVIKELKNITILEIDPMPFVELIHQKYCNDLHTDLLVITDPDEVMNQSLIQELLVVLKDFDLNVHSELRVNMNYFFKGKRLIGTYWGGVYSSRFIFNNRFLKFTGFVHDGISLEVNRPLDYKWKESSYIEHHWARNWHHLFEKHKRYLLAEGKSMASRGIKYSLSSHIYETVNAFWFSFRKKRGYKDGLTGFYLSVFWSWYTFKRWGSLKQFENNV
jgi:hypothetical protein